MGMMYSRQLTTLLATTLGVVLLLPGRLLAYEFRPNATEWAWWPAYCQARYVTVPVGTMSDYVNMVPRATITEWRNRLGPPFEHIHHYCAGLIWLERAKLAGAPHERKFALDQARGETRYTRDRVTADPAIFAEVVTHLGMIERFAGRPAEAIDNFDRAIASYPAFPGSYQGKALVLRDQGRLQDAREVLLEGNLATDGQSAEIHYFLGLVLVDLKDFAAAREHAQRAYELGYPLPGLRDRLARAGYPLN